MQTATIEDLRAALHKLDQEELLELCLKLARFKVENKELLTYLLFHQGNEEQFREMILESLRMQFNKANFKYLYFAKRNLWKIAKYLERCIKISSSKETEIELRIFFIAQIKEKKLLIYQSEAIYNVLSKQIRLAKEAIEKVHEDLQHDYSVELQEILDNYYLDNYYSPVGRP